MHLPLEKLRFLNERIMIRDGICYINSALNTMSKQHYICLRFIMLYGLFFMYALVTCWWINDGSINNNSNNDCCSTNRSTDVMTQHKKLWNHYSMLDPKHNFTNRYHEIGVTVANALVDLELMQIRPRLQGTWMAKVVFLCLDTSPSVFLSTNAENLI